MKKNNRKDKREDRGIRGREGAGVCRHQTGGLCANMMSTVLCVQKAEDVVVKAAGPANIE